MVAADDTPPVLTLELGSEMLPHRDFQRIVQAFMGLLDEIAKEACGKSDAIAWDISVSRESLLIAANLPPAMDARITKQVMDIVDDPTGKEIGNALERFPRVVSGTRILTGGDDRRDILLEEPEEPNRHPSQIAEYGTVEGILDTLSSRGKIRFTISEPIWNIGVRCTVPDDLVDGMQRMWRQRIAAHGMVRYDHNGLPTSIKAEKVELFPYDETPIEKYRGLFSAN